MTVRRMPIGCLSEKSFECYARLKGNVMADEKQIFVLCHSYPGVPFVYEDPIVSHHEADALDRRDQLFHADLSAEAVWIDRLTRKRVGKCLTREVPSPPEGEGPTHEPPAPE